MAMSKPIKTGKGREKFNFLFPLPLNSPSGISGFRCSIWLFGGGVRGSWDYWHHRGQGIRLITVGPASVAPDSEISDPSDFTLIAISVFALSFGKWPMRNLIPAHSGLTIKCSKSAFPKKTKSKSSKFWPLAFKWFSNASVNDRFVFFTSEYITQLF